MVRIVDSDIEQNFILRGIQKHGSSATATSAKERSDYQDVYRGIDTASNYSARGNTRSEKTCAYFCRQV
jgi:hypothetical protein